MGLSTAERNRRKRERKKREREERKKEEEDQAKQAKEESTKQKSSDPAAATDDDVEIEYVSEPILSEEVEGLRKFRDLVPLLTSTTTNQTQQENGSSSTAVKVEDDDDDDDDDDEDQDGESSQAISKRKLREKLRPTVADLKRKVSRPELVEAHDVTAADPEFLIELKSVPGTVPVPRNWGRKRKYLQGKVSFLKVCLVMHELILLWYVWVLSIVFLNEWII